MALTPLYLIVGPPRSGQGLLASLFDSHPEVLLIPMRLPIAAHWQNLMCHAGMSAGELVTLFLEHTELEKLNRGRYFDRSENRWVDTTFFKFNEFRTRFKQRLRDAPDRGLRQLVEAMHYAFAEAAGKKPALAKAIVLWQSDWESVLSVNEQLGQYIPLFTVRDPRGIYESVKNEMRMYQGGFVSKPGAFVTNSPFRTRHTGIANAFATITRYFYLQQSHSGKRIRLEDLSQQLEPTIFKVAEEMGIAHLPSLLQSTLHGVAWTGNSATRQSLGLHSHEVGERWKTTLTPAEQYFSTLYFEPILLDHGYSVSLPNLSTLGAMAKLVPPLKYELCYQDRAIFQDIPDRDQQLPPWLRRLASPLLVREVIRACLWLYYTPLAWAAYPLNHGWMGWNAFKLLQRRGV